MTEENISSTYNPKNPFAHSCSRREFLKALATLATTAVVLPTCGCFFIGSNTGDRRTGMHPYYLQKKDELISDFDGLTTYLEPLLQQRIDPAIAKDTLQAAQLRYALILEELPYIGGDGNWLTGNLIKGAMAAAFYLPMKERGRNVDEVGRMFYEAVEKAMSDQLAHPKVRAHDTTAINMARTKEQDFAIWTQKREYPYNWVSRYVECEGTPFDYGRDWLECGIVKLHKHYGIAELSPYLCLLDHIVFRVSGQGLHRTKTLAMGDDCCDFQINLGGGVISLEPFSEGRLREWGKYIK
ncbi:L-2-amino-thiazoline-4-carboxylic acid hydrolase [Chloroflexota bacterium]